MDERKAERRRRVNEFMEWDDDGEIVADAMDVLSRVAEKNPTISSAIVERVSGVVSSAVMSMGREIGANWNAIERSVVNKHMPHNLTPGQKVVYTTGIIERLFPEGTCDVPYACPATREFFKEWLENFRESEYFKKPDGDWAKRQGYSEYFKKVIENCSERNA